MLPPHLSLPVRFARVAAALLSLAPAAPGLQAGLQSAAPGSRPEVDAVVPFPLALFDVSPPAGEAPLSVHFTDRSLGEITSWRWSFGDGTTSSQRNPTKVFGQPGTYAVALTVKGPGGESRRERPEGVRVSACPLESARENRGYPLERGEDFVPVTGDDGLGFYCVYSGKAVEGGGPGISNNVGIFLFPLVNGEVLLFGAGYGDANWFVEPTESAGHDAARVDGLIRSCLGRTPERTPIRFLAPHGHIDHINADFVRELRRRGYPIRDIAFHSGDANAVKNLPGWTLEDRAAFLTLRNDTGACQEELIAYASPLGKLWVFLREGHTSGSVDLVIDVEGDPNNRVVVRGSGESYGTCPIPGVREAVEAHGNVLLQARTPELLAFSPANASALGTTTVVLSGEGFAASLAGLPEVRFGGVPASAVRVLDDRTLTCVAPPGVPGNVVEVELETHNGRSTLAAPFTYRTMPALSAVLPASASASGGAQVTLRGSGFLEDGAGNHVVTFAGAAASGVRVLDDRTLQCTVPPGSIGLANVRLANQNGVIELRAAFQYEPPLDLAGVTPATGSARGGTAVVIEGSAFAGGITPPDVWFGAARATEVVRLGDTRLACRTPAGTGGATVDVRVAGENGSATIPAAFRYFLEPKIVSLNPVSGPEAGGSLVMLSGSHFTRNQAGANAVTFGGVAASSIVTVSDSVIQCRVPAGAAGTSVDVVVSNANGSGRLAQGYRYHRRPALTALEPPTGGREGGTLVTLRGSGFLESGAAPTTVTFGGLPASEVTVLADDRLTCRTPPAALASTVDVQVRNANGSALLRGAFRYAAAPVLEALFPTAGPSEGSTRVTLTGSGFLAPDAGPARVTFDGAPANDVVIVSDTTLTCSTPWRQPRTTADVVVTNSNGSARLADAFRFLAPPSLASVQPREGPVAGGTRVVVSGSGFSEGPITVRFGASAATDVLVVDDQHIQCVTPAGARGTVNVSVRAAGGTAVLVEGFAYGPARLLLANLAPAHGPSAGEYRVVLEGAGFEAGDAGPATVTFGGVLAHSVVTQNDERLSCVVPPGAPGSRVDVRVSNRNGSAVLAGGYRYHLQPSLASLAPGDGSPLGGLLVTLRGSGFANDLTPAQVELVAVRFGATAATEVAVLDDTTLTCRVPPGTANTTVDVELESANGRAQLAAAFRYRGAPTLNSVTPSTGSPLGGTPVTLIGADFTLPGAGTTRVFFGSAAATQVIVASDTTITCLAPGGPAGTAVDVRVENATGVGTRSTAFRYHPAPLVASLAPASGLASGGAQVVLTGSGFKTNVIGANAVTFGGRPARSVTTVDDTRVRAVAPEGTPGERVDVVLANSNGTARVAQGFRYHALPTLATLEPPAASALGGTTVTLRGSGFLADAAGTNSVLFGGVPAISVVVLDDATLRCVEPGGAPGSEVGVELRNANGTAVAPLPYRYFPTPRIDALVPAFGFSGGGTLVELRGAGFAANGAGSNAVYFGTEEASEVTLLDDGTLRCRAPAGNPGPVPVRVENANGAGALSDAYYYDWAPTLTSVQPSHGTALGGTDVTLTGGGFATAGAGTLAVRFGSAPATNVRVLDGRTLTCKAPAGASATQVPVVVSNSRGSSSWTGFRYHALPTLTGVTPDSGPPEGGTLVTLLGTGFLADGAGTTTITFDGVSATGVLVLDDGHVQCLTPPGPTRTSATLELTNRNGRASFADGFRWRTPDPSDVDNDGVGDAMLSSAEGVFVFFGVPLGQADESTASADLALRHTAASTDFGAQVTSGDVNADGIADLVVAAPLDDGGGTDTGAVFVYFGPLSASPTVRLSSSASAVFRGAAAGDRFGASVCVRDVTGDGTSDLLVGAPLNDAADPDGGAVYVYRGRTGFSGQTTSQAAVRLLASGSSDSFGAAIACGDVTGDQVADVIVGAPLYASGTGVVYVFRGGATLTNASAGSALVRLDGASNDDLLGTSVGAGDFDGDGVADLFLGAPAARSGGIGGGLLYYLRGATLSSRSVDDSSSEIVAESSGDRVGQVLAVGDANGDGLADVLVGAPQHDVPASNSGRAYLLLGGPMGDGSIEQRAHTILMAESSSGDQFGTALALCDLDGDGSDELIVGAPFANAGASDSGRVYVFLGASLQASRSAAADDLTLSGTSAGQLFGREAGGAR